MAKDIVMVHGASCGGWCFDPFRAVFEGLGWTCHTPDLIGHGKDATGAAARLVGVGLADYRNQLLGLLKAFPTPPVLLGHSMGAVLAQQLAALGLARALVLVSPAPRAGILPTTDGERQLDRDLMALGALWTKVIDPDFDLACIYSLNRVPAAEQRQVFDRFGPESGRAYFELFFWMFDQTRAAVRRYRRGPLPRAVPVRHRRPAGGASDRARDRSDLSRRGVLGVGRPRALAAGGA